MHVDTGAHTDKSNKNLICWQYKCNVLYSNVKLFLRTFRNIYVRRYDGGRLQMKHTVTTHSYAFCRFVSKVICTTSNIAYGLAYLISAITHRDYVNASRMVFFFYWLKSIRDDRYLSVLYTELVRPFFHSLYIYIYTNHILRTCYFYCCVHGVTLIWNGKRNKKLWFR